MEKERLKFSIERFDHYYDSVNNKSAVFLALSTFIVGGLIAYYPNIIQKVNCNQWVYLLMGIVICLGVSIMILLTITIMPFNRNGGESLIHFKYVANNSRETFFTKSVEYEFEDELSDLRNQVHELAIGLKKKFNRLKITGWLFIIQFVLFIPLFLFLITNLK